MTKRLLQILCFIFFSATSSVYADAGEIAGNQCAMKNLAVTCDKGEKIKFDVIRTYDQRGDVFLKIKAAKAIGNYLLLSINGEKPSILKMQNVSTTSKGAYIPRDVILKLRSATSVQFKIAMENGTPLLGSLTQNHFEWLKRFGQACS